MPTTYEPIATTTLGSAASSVTFSSISGSYTDLVLVSNVSGSGGNANLRITLNSDTGSSYSTTALSGDGSSAVSNRSSNQTAMLVVQTGASLNAAWTTYISHFMNYSNTTTYKTALSRFAAAGSETTANVHLWRSTSAVTSITIATSTNNYASGSTFTLYGIKAA
jgi:hypothetical protein